MFQTFNAIVQAHKLSLALATWRKLNQIMKKCTLPLYLIKISFQWGRIWLGEVHKVFWFGIWFNNHISGVCRFTYYLAPNHIISLNLVQKQTCGHVRQTSLSLSMIEGHSWGNQMEPQHGRPVLTSLSQGSQDLLQYSDSEYFRTDFMYFTSDPGWIGQLVRTPHS